MGTNSIKSYKGFDKDLKCKGFQYEVGKEYEMEDIEICKRGFHACENPFDIFNYYDMLDSRFCEVEQSGVIQREGNDTKICSSKIKIIRELKLRDMINLGIEWLDKSISQSRTTSGNYVKIGSSGDYAQIGSSGDFAQIGSSGDSAQINSEGEDSVIMCAGINSMAKAKRGSWITLAEWKFSEEKNRNIPILVKTEYVDGERIKENVWYRLVNGEFVEQDN